MLFHGNGRHPPDQKHHQRHGDEIHGNGADEKPDIRIIDPGERKPFNEEDFGILYPEYEQCPEKVHQAQAVEVPPDWFCFKFHK